MFVGTLSMRRKPSLCLLGLYLKFLDVSGLLDRLH